MNCETNQWYVRWFSWSCWVLDRSIPLDRYRRVDRYRRGTNLCHFFRTIMWGTVLTMVNLVVGIYALMVVLWLPFYLFPLWSVATAVGVVAAVISMIVIAVIAIVYSPDAVQYVKQQMQRSAPAIVENTPPSFVQICFTYVKSIKHRFCPTITFKDNNNGQA
jgi:hypothetical protein